MAGKSFVQQRLLNWGEADPAGTIYAPRAIDFAIQAIEALWIEALGFSFRECHERRGMGTPWVHTSCEFERPLRAGEPFALHMILEKMGESSFAWRGEAARPEGETLFRLKLVAVMLDTRTGRACPIPADIRTGLQPYVA